jgi:hypothetical protein
MTKGRRNQGTDSKAAVQASALLAQECRPTQGARDSIRRHVKVDRVGGHPPGLDVDLNQTEDHEIVGGD